MLRPEGISSRSWLALAILIAAGTYVVPGSQAAAAEEAFYEVAIGELPLIDAELPKDWDKFQNTSWHQWHITRVMAPYVAVEGAGEAFPEYMNQFSWQQHKLLGIAARGKRGEELRGTLFIPKTDWSGMLALPFRIPSEEADRTAEHAFHKARSIHYSRMINQGVAGTAWFRWQYSQAIRAIGEKPDAQENPLWTGRGMDDTFEMFSGGRAISENLQLNRQLLTAKDAKEELTVPLDSLPGITIAEIDWTKLLQPGDVKLDALASQIPHDQHVVFFPTFQGMLNVMDEAERLGAPLIVMSEPRTEDAKTKERYQTQLCLETSVVSRLLGPQLISSVAVTGSDPYLRTGTDLAIVFETKQKEVLTNFVRTKHAAAVAGPHKAKLVKGEVEGTSYEGAVSSDNRVSSYLASFGNTVVVTNSLHQLQQIAKVARGASPSLASLPEYKFFRQRYPLGEGESAFLMITDATIRRWCSAKWRIGNSRRLRAGAVLSEIAAEYQDEQVQGNFQSEPIDFPWKLPQMGKITLTHAGPKSEAYGSLAWQTPIAELPLDKVSNDEAQAFRRWLEQYQQQWRFFDPIAGTVSLRKDALAVDLSVLPLILGTEYVEFTRIIGKSEVSPGAADPHAEALAHFALATDRESDAFKQLESLVSGWVTNGDLDIKGKKVSPLAWWGKTAAIYADESPVWGELAKAKDLWEYVRQNKVGLPIVLHVDSTDQAVCQAFAHRLVEQMTQPNSRFTVEKKTHDEQNYVVCLESNEELNFCIAATNDAFLLALDEATLKRAMDRKLKPVELPAAQKEWLGKHLAGRVTSAGLAAWQAVFWQNALSEMQAKSWGNLPILNEWKKRYPTEDPVALHERLWHAQLVCPGGGKYVWNEKWRTMESTVFGHPGEPKGPPIDKLKLLPGADGLAFGLTFEQVKGTLPASALQRPGTTQPAAGGQRDTAVFGLRAKLEIKRSK